MGDRERKKEKEVGKREDRFNVLPFRSLCFTVHGHPSISVGNSFVKKGIFYRPLFNTSKAKSTIAEKRSIEHREVCK